MRVCFGLHIEELMLVQSSKDHLVNHHIYRRIDL
jgi:hypothetical protein